MLPSGSASQIARFPRPCLILPASHDLDDGCLPSGHARIAPRGVVAIVHAAAWLDGQWAAMSNPDGRNVGVPPLAILLEESGDAERLRPRGKHREALPVPVGFPDYPGSTFSLHGQEVIVVRRIVSHHAVVGAPELGRPPFLPRASVLGASLPAGAASPEASRPWTLAIRPTPRLRHPAAEVTRLLISPWAWSCVPTEDQAYLPRRSSSQ